MIGRPCCSSRPAQSPPISQVCKFGAAAIAVGRYGWWRRCGGFHRVVSVEVLRTTLHKAATRVPIAMDCQSCRRLPRVRASWSCRRRSSVMNASKNEQNLGTATAAAASEPPRYNNTAPAKAIKAHLLDDASSDAAQAARALSERGFCVCRGGLDASIVGGLGARLRSLNARDDAGRLSRFGRDDLVKARRDDPAMWLHEYLNAVGGPEKGGCSTLTALDGCLASFGEAVMEAMSGIDKPGWFTMGRVGPKEAGSSSSPIH